MKEALIIVPAYNEQENIKEVIENIKLNTSNFDYVIINDCSTDRTKQICEANDYNIINLPVNLGIGGSVQTGYLYAKKYNYKYAVQFDGDGQHDAQYLEIILREIKKNENDMVIGSRFINNEGFQSSFYRRMGIKFLSQLIKIRWKQEIKDVTSGFRIVNKSIINEFCDYYPSDYPEPESISYCIRKKYRIKEIPVIMKERRGGESSINLVRAVYYMVKVSLAIIIDSMKL